MKVSELIGKALSGAGLTEAEKDYLVNYQEPDVKDRIPKSRLDQEISRRRESEEKIAALQQQLEELAGQGLSEQEKISRRLDTVKEQLSRAEQERDQALAARSELEFRSRVGELSNRSGFSDSEYLGFLAKQRQIDLGDGDVVAGFVADLRRDCPKFFRIETAGGAGSGGDAEPAGFAAAAASGDIEAMIAAAPRLGAGR